MAQVNWIKVSVDLFEDEKMRLIQALPEGDALTILWVRLLTMAGKTNDSGYVYLKEGTPYTPQMLSIIWAKPQPVVELAVKTFIDFGMIEIDGKGIYICNWDKHQNIDGLDKIKKQTNERVKRYRERKKQEQQALEAPKEDNEVCNVTVTYRNATEENRKEKNRKEKKRKKDSPVEAEASSLLAKNIQDIWKHYLKTFDGFFSRLTLTENRKKVIKQRLKDPHPEKKGELLFSVDDIKLAISNIRQSAFHCGDNDKKKFYAHIDFICRNADMVEKWMNETSKPKQQKVVPFNKQGGNNNATNNNVHGGHSSEIGKDESTSEGTGYYDQFDGLFAN